MRVKETNTPKKTDYHLLTLLFLVGMFCAVIFGAIGYQWGYRTGQIEANTTIAVEQSKILDTQKLIISQIMDYQIKHGANAVQWGVNVNFGGGETE